MKFDVNVSKVSNVTVSTPGGKESSEKRVRPPSITQRTHCKEFDINDEEVRIVDERDFERASKVFVEIESNNLNETLVYDVKYIGEDNAGNTIIRAER